MIALSLFVLICAAGVVYLLWFLSESDKAADAVMATISAHEAAAIKAEATRR